MQWQYRAIGAILTERGGQLALRSFGAAPSSFANVHSSKRAKNERTGVHAWHPYYAGYAQRFVEDVLGVLARDGDVILDLWNGSGTTTLICQKAGLRSIGVEINPVMAVHARAKDLRLASQKAELVTQAEHIASAASCIVPTQIPEHGGIARWVHPEPLRVLLSLRTTICEQPNAAFFLSALFQVLRKVGSFGPGKNPTWIVADESVEPASEEEVFCYFIDAVRTMLDDLEQAAMGARALSRFQIILGNSKSVSLPSNSVDVIVTSPPYLTRIDYTVSTKPELLLLGRSEAQITRLRRSTMGAPVIADKSIRIDETWGPTCLQFLQAVGVHPSKGSRSYYVRNFLQYFNDAALSMRQVLRVLTPRGRAAIVLQSSFYKDIELALGDVYVEMAQALGLDAEIVRREIVRGHMAYVNTRSSRYVSKKVYFEDVVLITKR